MATSLPLIHDHLSLFLSSIQCHYNSARLTTRALLESYLPSFDLLDVLLLYTLCIYFLWVLNKVFCYIWKNGLFSPLKKWLFKFIITKIPFARERFKKEITKIERDFNEELDKSTYKKTAVLPIGGMKLSTIKERLDVWLKKDDSISNSGLLSGTKYVDKKDYEDFLKGFSKEFAFHNLLHFDIYHACRQMEAEILAMTGDLLNTGKEVYGTTTSGGTESICMAIFTYREWARDKKGITEPEMIIPVTAHVAFDKAAHYYGIKLIKIPIDSRTGKAQLSHLKRSITRNTICIVGSCPGFPHGIIDPLEEMAYIARKNNIGFHVDCCLGGFLVVFAQANGITLPKFDFSLPGVTSISIDHHKYGLAPKGVSAVFYKTKELRQYQYFSTTTWPGGLYLTPNAMGSRSGAPIAGAWFAMMYQGFNTYKENAALVFQAVKKVKETIYSIKELEVIGDPFICVVSFKSRVKWLNIYAIDQVLKEKGWHMAGIQKPAAIHFGITVANARSVDRFIADLKEAMQKIKENPAKYKGGSVAALYGTANMIPDEKVVDEVTKIVVDCMLKI